MKWTLLIALAACHSTPAPAPIKETPPPASAQPPATSGEARVVQRTATGGVIELVGGRSAAMDRATAEMATHCGGKDLFTIVQEGEEVLGDDGSARPKTAWRVHYACNGAL